MLGVCSGSVLLSEERNDQMFAAKYVFAFLPNFMTEWWFIIALGVVAVGLTGLLIFLRKQRSDEED